MSPRPTAARPRAAAALAAGGLAAACLAGGLLAAGPLPAGAGEPVRPPRRCPQDAPPGVRFPDRPECRDAPAPVRAGSPGWIDLGNGTTLRVGGRAAFEAGTRR
ncbi:hypothetical protein OPKNFCMD_1831 [Methylobacterium crusticola]|uniref:Porin n=1 Tax=Methylobacterium crusticola TaxID=1697972 RepID=A0ABQ4QWT4_9HYPH|nr:hypothetical protein [Methylobacterium crusticola]GJD49101.1 hypothetical protein OPKNFCMD_1831 [Methylobacterium crusticola]